MKITPQNVDEWVERFMNGETTAEEERALYRFFRQGNVPRHLHELAPMFAWYEAGMPGKPEEFMQHYRAPQRYTLKKFMVAAACLLLLAVVGGTLWNSSRLSTDQWACYEGSYVIINGQRIDDLEEIMPRLQQSLQQVEQMEQRMLSLEKRLSTDSEEELKQQLWKKAPNESVRRALQEAWE